MMVHRRFHRDFMGRIAFLGMFHRKLFVVRRLWWNFTGEDLFFYDFSSILFDYFKIFYKFEFCEYDVAFT